MPENIALDIFLNVCANLISVPIGIAISWLFFVRPRRQLLKFYGIDASKKIVIYLSNIEFNVSHGEMREALRFRDLFNYLLPSLSDKPGVLSKLLISDIRVEIIISQPNQGQPERSSSFITLGSPMHNAVSGFVEKEFHSQVRFESDYSAMQVKDAPPITDRTCGFVERIVDHEQNRYIFYVAGPSGLGTMGAAHFLATERARLHRKYSNDTNFVVMLRLDDKDFKRWSIVFER